MSRGAALVETLLRSVGREGSVANEVEIRGADPVIHTPFCVGEAAAAALAGVGVAISDLWELRTGRRQRVAIDVQAAVAALVSFAHLRGDGLGDLQRSRSTTTAFVRAKDAWVHLHGGFPRLHEGTLSLLGCRDDADSIARAVATWEAQPLEDALAERRLCGARVRSAEEWAAHPQGRALAAVPLVEIRRFGDADPVLLPEADRPLAGVRVLDLTRVLAGPTCGRTLAEHGADVLRIHAPHLPFVPPFAIDTGHGKLSAHLDLRDADDAERLQALVRGADVFSRGYRPGALERRGFDLASLARLRPGIVVVSIDCYGHEGPWAERAGWEQLAQAVSGIAAEQGDASAPRLIPAAATDYTTGYLAAFGALVALARRAREGGSFEVRVSLARAAMWLLSLDRAEGEPTGLEPGLLDRYMTSSAVAAGTLHHLGPVLELSETRPHWSRPTVPLGTHPPVWP